MMRRLALGLVLAFGCNANADSKQAPAPAHDKAIPDVGAKAPGGTLLTAKNAKVELASLWPKHAKTVLVFYRGFY